MKKIITLALAITCGTALAQKSDNVGIGTTKPDPSALLELNSTSKGLLLPRMTEAQRNSINKPVAGLVIYQIDQAIGSYTYNGTTWIPNARIGGTESALGTGAWDMNGNNTADATNFIGVPAGVPINFKIGGVNSGAITDNNLFLGYQSGVVNASGSNLGIGKGTLKSNTIGAANFAVGSDALSSNVDGIWNFAAGIDALKSNVSGTYHMGLGARSLFKQNGGTASLGVGADALYNNVTGSWNVAIGINSGYNNLGSDNVFIGNNSAYNETGSGKLYIANSNTSTPLIGGDFTNRFLKLHTGAIDPTSTAGFVAIGDFSAAGTSNTPGVGGINTFPNFINGTSKYRLVVQDGILTEKLKVALRNGAEWADYVFASDYKLMPLEEVEKFAVANHHLPNVLSAEDMVKEGLDVTKTTAKLMEKIEELTLYIIELNKKIKVIEDRNK